MVAAIPEEIKNKIISTIPVGRLGEADEIAKLAVYLAADESSYITGSTISINGGQYFS
jgi:acetoacetyl-CoA reductase